MYVNDNWQSYLMQIYYEKKYTVRTRKLSSSQWKFAVFVGQRWRRNDRWDIHRKSNQFEISQKKEFIVSW